MSLGMAVLTLALFSLLAFWRPSAPLFMLVGTIAIFTGLQWYDVYVTPTGLAIGMCILAYGLVAYGFAFRCIFIRENKGAE